MQIVIDIPDYDYRQIKEYYEKNDNVEATYSYIYHGIPLPKGHGRIIDEDQIPGDNGWDFSDRLMSTPTIIESEDKDDR